MMKRGLIVWLRFWIMSTLSSSSGESTPLLIWVDTDGRLHANGNAEEDTFSLSTHMVHPSIIAAGREWTNLRIQEVQGMFLCPPPFTCPSSSSLPSYQPSLPLNLPSPAPTPATARLTYRRIPMPQLLRPNPIRSNSSPYPPPIPRTRTQYLPRSTANGSNPFLPS